MKFACTFLCVLLGLLALASAPPLSAADTDTYTRKDDVVYGRKFGMAMTMDVFAPKEKANGAAVIWVVSGGWFSSRDAGMGKAPRWRIVLISAIV